MRYFTCLAVALMSLFLLASCGSSSAKQSKTAASQDAASAQSDSSAGLDCDNFMQSIADNCFAKTAFEEDGVTPVKVLDEAGNVLGEVDQEWAAGYCECFAQLAFQTFGCETVMSHEKLDDEAYEATYADVIRACTNLSFEQNETADEPANDEDLLSSSQSTAE